MNAQQATYLYVEAFVDELARSGVRHACLSPGSRSTPLALMLARNGQIRVWTHIDERSAAFFALGMAMALREPVALLSTSGTAAANFYPAVIEARYGRVPLVVLTADRPHELRDVGSSQAIDQLRLYGPHVKWFAEMAVPEATPDMIRYARTVACRAVATARACPAGPVHLNFPFREPLVPQPVEAPLAPRTAGLWRPHGLDPDADRRPYVIATQGARMVAPSAAAALAEQVASAKRGLIVCGPQDDPQLPRAVTRLAAALAFPVLADPLSGVRCGHHDGTLVIDGYDAFLRDAGLADSLRPDLVLRVGAMPVSKPLMLYLDRHPTAFQVVVDGGDGWRDPTLRAAEVVHADPVPLFEELAARVRGPVADAKWRRLWVELNTTAREALQRQLQAMEGLFEGRVFAELASLLPDGATLFVGNSMPVRDLDGFFPACRRDIRFLANRGASGIDGVVSSALGAAAVTPGPLALVIGDLSFYHDLNGLLAARRFGLDVTVILLNNDGGGIFSFLPQADHPEHFEELFGTPLGIDFAPAVEMYGGRLVRAGSWQQFQVAVRQAMAGGGLVVVEVRTDRRRNVTQHRQAWSAVAEAVRAMTRCGCS
ncbi:MAG: 2-succinyl-5-enolpyruvyl-6-hydroxy-3-cyclohexene-1-carboxylic-acid synthase [Bacillota bacterium]